MTAPRVEVRLDRVAENARALVTRLAPKGIAATGVTKACLGRPAVARAMLDGGVRALGDSRIENVMALRAAGCAAPVTLLRSPMVSQAERVVAFATASCNSERVVLEHLAEAALALGRAHRVILMVELGDLREGVMPDAVEPLARWVRDRRGLELAGIGTNLACQSGVVPDAANMSVLSELSTAIESELSVELATVSGGNSANLAWALAADDVGRVNELRLGESILLGRDPVHRGAIGGLHTDAFRLVAEVIESQDKPARPWGTVGRSAFGVASARTGTGTVRQALLALGRQDVDPDGLGPPAGMRVLGASSDHVVLDTGSEHLAVGAEVSFGLDYGALMRAMTSPFVALAEVDGVSSSAAGCLERIDSLT